MLKSKTANIFFFFLIKYLTLYLLLAFKNDNFLFFELSNIKYFMYWWMLLFMPVSCFLLFVLPIYSVFLLKNWLLRILILFAVFIAEYFFYTHMASQLDPYNGLYNGILSIIFFILFFYKSVGCRIKLKVENT